MKCCLCGRGGAPRSIVRLKDGRHICRKLAPCRERRRLIAADWARELAAIAKAGRKP